jgi:plasmid stabilization system protein ParE
MAALRRVEWSARAERDLDRLYAFVLERWTEREADHLLDMVQEFEALVARWPNGFKRDRKSVV